MTCAAGSRPICTTCGLAGLIRCPGLGTPLPLVEDELVRVEHKPMPGLRHVREFLKVPKEGQA